MKKYIDWIVKHKVKTGFILLATFFAPLIIVQALFMWDTDISFLRAKWGAGELLGYIAAFLAFISTTLLGVVAIRQSEQAQKLNKSMQMLQQAEFVSMVSLVDVDVNKRSEKHPTYNNPKFTNPEIINMAIDSYICGWCYHIDLAVQNNSEFPLVELNAHCCAYGDFKCELYFGIQNVSQAIYITKHQTQNMRLIIPSQLLETYGQDKLVFQLQFVNVFDYVTDTSLFLTLPMGNNVLEHKFRIAKIIDVKPETCNSN